MIGKRGVADQLSILGLSCILAVSAALADSLAPEDTYIKYRAALADAKKIEDLQSMLCRDVNEKIEQTPPDMRPMMFGLLKDLTPKDVQVLSETVNGNGATLVLSGKTEPAGSGVSEKTTGKVTLVKEDGIWKIDKEAWNSKIEIGGKSQPPSK